MAETTQEELDAQQNEIDRARLENTQKTPSLEDGEQPQELPSWNDDSGRWWSFLTTKIVANPSTLIPFLYSQLGYTEKPTNRTKYGEWYGMNGEPWCAMFDSYSAHHSGNPLPPIATSKGYAFTPDLKAYAVRSGQWRTVGYTPKPCDQALFSFGGERIDHVERVIKYLGDGRVSTIGGNVGGKVKDSNRRHNIVGFVSVEYVSLPPAIDPGNLRSLFAAKLREQYGATANMGGQYPFKEDVKALQASLNLAANGGLKIDGVYGQATIKAVLRFQRWMNKLGANITDFPGSSGELTRFYLCYALERIRDGLA